MYLYLSELQRENNRIEIYNKTKCQNKFVMSKTLYLFYKFYNEYIFMLLRSSLFQEFPISKCLDKFLEANNLPESYIDWAKDHFQPVLELIVENHRKKPKSPQIFGINGCQGSGKTTLASFICEYISAELDIQTITLSMDDFYLTRSERRSLAKRIHRLLLVRGVPGTHDVDLALSTINSLIEGNNTLIPRFDKSEDDRVTKSNLIETSGSVKLIIIEGWCFGARPQTERQLQKPINDLEKKFDTQGVYRKYVNKCLSGKYQNLFKKVDYLLMLKAPSFQSVYKWRLEQEHKLRESLFAEPNKTEGSLVMTDAEVWDFIQYFQRITEGCLLDIPSRANFLYELDDSRNIKFRLCNL